MRNDVSKCLLGNTHLVMGMCNGEFEFNAFSSPLSLHDLADELSPVVGADPFDKDLIFVSIRMMAKYAC